METSSHSRQFLLELSQERLSSSLHSIVSSFHSKTVIERLTLSLTYPLLYHLYNQQSFSGLPHGVTVNHISQAQKMLTPCSHDDSTTCTEN